MNKLLSVLALSIALWLPTAASANANELVTVTVMDQKSEQVVFMTMLKHASLEHGVVLSQVETLPVLRAIRGNQKTYSNVEVGSKMKLQLGKKGRLMAEVIVKRIVDLRPVHVGEVTVGFPNIETLTALKNIAIKADGSDVQFVVAGHLITLSGL